MIQIEISQEYLFERLFGKGIDDVQIFSAKVVDYNPYYLKIVLMSDKFPKVKPGCDMIEKCTPTLHHNGETGEISLVKWGFESEGE
jgi:hypothetical protein